jgi:hypothetical protein
VNTHPKNALKILQLLLRCGMICREDLNVVLEMMRPREAAPHRAEGAPQSRRQTPTLEFDNRA